MPKNLDLSMINRIFVLQILWQKQQQNQQGIIIRFYL